MSLQLIVQSIGGGLLTGAVYGIAAVGLALVFGVMKVVNFAHGVMIMLGMYAAWFLTEWTSLGVFLVVPLAIPVGVALGWLIQYFLLDDVMESGEEAPLLVTLGLALIIEAGAQIFFTSNPRSLTSQLFDFTVSVGPAQFRFVRIATFVAALLFALLLGAVLRNTDLGRGIRAVSQDRQAAQLMGFNVRRTYGAAYGLGTGAAFFAGGLAAPILSISPSAGTPLLLMSFVAAVLGGLGNIRGAFLAGILVGVAEGLGALFLPGTMKTLLVFGLFILVLLLRPEGLFRR